MPACALSESSEAVWAHRRQATSTPKRARESGGADGASQGLLGSSDEVSDGGRGSDALRAREAMVRSQTARSGADRSTAEMRCSNHEDAIRRRTW